jgi:hypothetical protein
MLRKTMKVVTYPNINHKVSIANQHSYRVQQISLFSHLQSMGIFKHDGQIIMPQPTHLLVDALQAQCLHSFPLFMTQILHSCKCVFPSLFI